MCLIALAYKIHPKYKLILIANRDEFYARPTAVAHWWRNDPDILGGKDLQAKGTWMAIHKNGRFAAVTNYRDLKNIKTGARSRGDLVVRFLKGTTTPFIYCDEVRKGGDDYNGFNLITLDDELTYVSNYSPDVQMLNPGIYGLSNTLLNTPWPKVEKAKQALHTLIQRPFELGQLMAIMQGTATVSDEELPRTGLDYEWEKALSAIFIRMPDYGTCCSTVIVIDYEGNVNFMEKNYWVDIRTGQILLFNFLIKK